MPDTRKSEGAPEIAVLRAAVELGKERPKPSSRHHREDDRATRRQGDNEDGGWRARRWPGGLEMADLE